MKWIGGLAVVVALTFAAPVQAEKIDALLVTGVDPHHDWERNATLLAEQFETWDAFEIETLVRRNDDEWAAWDGDFADHDVVILVYNGHIPHDVVDRLTEYVEGGGGLSVIHSSVSCVPEHEAFNEMIGMGWRDADYGYNLQFGSGGSEILREPGDGGGAAHPPLMDFEVRVRDPHHPITQGFPMAWMQSNDELYYNLRGPVGDIHVLATAEDPNGELAPQGWVNTRGEGRIFVSTLGHHEPAIMNVGATTFAARGTEWAAKGGVTLAMPENFPTADETVEGRPEF